MELLSNAHRVRLLHRGHIRHLVINTMMEHTKQIRQRRKMEAQHSGQLRKDKWKLIKLKKQTIALRLRTNNSFCLFFIFAIYILSTRATHTHVSIYI